MTRKTTRRQCLTSDDAVPATQQHTKPCADCPWARAALRGWLGPASAEQWIAAAHGEQLIFCHTLIGAQCAGAAVYRANVGKLPRDRHALKLLPDTERVFAGPAEFTQHHHLGGKKPRKTSKRPDMSSAAMFERERERILKARRR